MAATPHHPAAHAAEPAEPAQPALSRAERRGAKRRSGGRQQSGLANDRFGGAAADKRPVGRGRDPRLPRR